MQDPDSHRHSADAASEPATEPAADSAADPSADLPAGLSASLHSSPNVAALTGPRRRLWDLPSAAHCPVLADWWDRALQSRDPAGADWAMLSHPRCSPALAHCVLGHMDKLQHQAGIDARADQHRAEALIVENAVLARALAAAQRRCQQQAAEHRQRCNAVQADNMRLRARLLAQHKRLAQLQEALARLKASVPGLGERSAPAAPMPQP